MQINKAHNFFFHPLAKEHAPGIKILSTITVIALSILTAGIFLLAFAIVNLRDRKVNTVQNDSKKIPNPFTRNKPEASLPRRNEVPMPKRRPLLPPEKITNPTAALLNNEYGFSYSPNEPNGHPSYGSIGAIQGHEKFRAEVAKITKQDTHALSPKAIRENREINPELSLKLTAKRLGHALSLNGQVFLEDGDSVNFEGFSETFTLPMLADSFEKFSQENPHLVSQDMAKWVLEHFTNVTRSDAITDQEIANYREQLKNKNFEGPLCVSTGHDWHLINLIFYRHFVFSMNRGGDPFELQFEGENLGKLDGINIFTADKAFDLSAPTAAKIFKRMSVQRHQSAKTNVIQKELDLQFFDVKHSKSQKVGNCTYVNTKLVILTLLALYSLKDNEKIITPDLDRAFNEANKIYKEWVKFDRNYVVKDLVEEVKSLHEAGKKDSMIYRVLHTLLQHASRKTVKLDPNLAGEVATLSRSA